MIILLLILVLFLVAACYARLKLDLDNAEDRIIEAIEGDRLRK